MGLFERWRGKQDNKVVEKVVTYINNVWGNSNHITKFSEDKAYLLALQLSEIFFPIDAIADRAASIPYEIRNEANEPITLTNRQKELLDRPNLFCNMGDLIYSIVFSLMADGNQYLYTNCSTNSPKADYITNIWSIPPTHLEVKYKNRTPSIFEIKDKSELIEHYKISLHGQEKIDPRFITHTRSSFLRENTSFTLEGRSPLTPAEKNINNLLAVYEARFKIYDSNGMAGILSRAAITNAGGDLAQAMLDTNPISQKQMAEDLRGEYGLRGDKNLYGYAPYPLSFIKTVADIRDLMPFEETLADAIAIAGIYGVDKDLVPQLKGTTFTNKAEAEVGLWQNVIKGVCYDVCRILDKAFLLPDNHHFAPVFDRVEALQEDKKDRLEGDKLMIENMKIIKESGLENDPTAKRILEGYEKY